MTEDQAKTRWCPFSRIAYPGANTAMTTVNRSVGKGRAAEVLCLGSDCMAWRWSNPPDEAAGNRNRPQGYCGLAGKP